MGEEILGHLGYEALKYQAEHVIDHAKEAVHDVAQGHYLDAAEHAGQAVVDSTPGLGLANSAGEDLSHYIQTADAGSDGSAGYSSDGSYAHASYGESSSDDSYDTSSYDSSEYA